MKKIGLVGGTGPESTLIYYRELNSRIDRLTNGALMPDLSIESVNFRRAWEYVSMRQYDKLADYLSEKVENLIRSGAEIISLTAATMHIVFNKIEEKTNAKLISIPEAIRDAAVEKGYKKVGLLGTIFTMEQDYMKKDLIGAGIEVAVPEKNDRMLTAKRIFEELEFGIVKKSTLDEFNAIIMNMKEKQGIEAVILGCTELPLLLNDDNCILPCMDSVDLHINRLIKLAVRP